jgi:hypothetical protein
MIPYPLSLCYANVNNVSHNQENGNVSQSTGLSAAITRCVPVFHGSLVLDPSDTPTDQKWRVPPLFLLLNTLDIIEEASSFLSNNTSIFVKTVFYRQR